MQYDALPIALVLAQNRAKRALIGKKDTFYSDFGGGKDSIFIPCVVKGLYDAL